MKILRASLAFLLSVLLGGTFAVAEPGSGERPGREEMREKIMERFDADGDGELNEEERAEARKARREMFGREGRGPGAKAKGAGKRGPGKAQGQRQGRGRGPDAEGQRGGRRGPGQGGPDGPREFDPDQIFDRIDADGDGLIDRQEFGEHAQVMRQRMRAMRDRQGPGGRGERGPRGDRDGDFESERFRPNFNRDGEFDRRPPRGRRGGPEGQRGEFRKQGREFGPPGPPRMGRGHGEGRPGPPEFRRGPRRGGEEDGPPRAERRRRGRPAPKDAEDADDSTSSIEESTDDATDVDVV